MVYNTLVCGALCC